MFKIVVTLKTVQNYYYYSFCKIKHLPMLYISVCLFTGAVLTVKIERRSVVN
jgi:hypothetical protein